MISYAVPHLRQTTVDDVQGVHYYHTCKQCCKSLFNLFTSRTAVGLRQEFGCMFQVFGLCHSLQLIQWEEVPCDCWLCAWSHFPSEGWPALHSNKKRWMHGIFGPHSQRPKIVPIPSSFPSLVRAQPVPNWPHDRGGMALQSPILQESLQSFPDRFGALITK